MQRVPPEPPWYNTARPTLGLAEAGKERLVQESPEADVAVLDDGALLRLLHEQPRAGAAALYDRYGRLVFSVALRMVGDRGAAEEITQDVFVGCWRNAASYRAEQSRLTTWLLALTHHRAVDELRSRRYKLRSRETAWDAVLEPGLVENHVIDAQLLQADVRAALAELPEAQREVIELLYYGGLTRQQAADRLHTPLGTIHTRLRLGMAKLRGSLAYLFADDGPAEAERSAPTS